MCAGRVANPLIRPSWRSWGAALRYPIFRQMTEE
jgi:hypothetical protein